MTLRRRSWIFALAALAPAVALGFLAIRSIQSEETLRRSEAEDQARKFLKVAAQEIQADLEGRLTNGERLRQWPPAPPEELPELSVSMVRERPDLASILDRARALEFVESRPANAKALYLDLSDSVDNPRTRGRLIAAAARCASQATEKEAAVDLLRRLVSEFAGVAGDSPFPLDIGARLQLISLDVDRDLHARELLKATLNPASQLVLLHRLESLGIPVEDRGEGPRFLLAAEARGLTPGEIVWHPGTRGVWAAVGGAGVIGVHWIHPVPSDGVRARLLELARVAGVRFGIRSEGHWFGEPGPDGASEIEVANGALRIVAGLADPSAIENLTASRRMTFTGLVVLLIAVMVGGLFASFRAAQREMRLARLKSDFISGVSHELRTPLTSIRIFADLLSTPGPAEKREEHAALLKREAERLSGLVERVLDFSRLEKGGAAYRLEERNLAAVVDEAVRTFRTPRPGFAVRVMRSDDPLPARVDALGVEQIVHNLLDNAAKYAGPETEVVLRREGGRAILEVKDRGPGIAQADLPHVFETFYRGPSSTPGTGLGLSIVRQIAEAHGGSVRVASAPDEGATFSVEIPLCRASSS